MTNTTLQTEVQKDKVNCLTLEATLEAVELDQNPVCLTPEDGVQAPTYSILTTSITSKLRTKRATTFMESRHITQMNDTRRLSITE